MIKRINKIKIKNNKGLKLINFANLRIVIHLFLNPLIVEFLNCVYPLI